MCYQRLDLEVTCCNRNTDEWHVMVLRTDREHRLE